MLKITFNNLGNIDKGEIIIKDFTILCGDNNTGKTYSTYAIYSLLEKDFNYNFKNIKEIVIELLNNGFYELNLEEFTDKNYITLKKEIEKGFSNNLYMIFSASSDEFSNSNITFEIPEDTIKNNIIYADIMVESSIGKNKNITFEAIKKEKEKTIKFILHANKMSVSFLEDTIKNILAKIIFRQLFSKSFLLPAERTGLNLFYKELGRERTTLLHHLQKPNIDTMDLIKDLIVSRYPQPIGDYIDFLNDTHNLRKIKSDYKDLAVEIQKEILHGKYKVENDGIYFLPYKNHSSKNNFNDKISLHMASSTVKTFFSLVFYLEHLAQKYSTLIIDEPELNLHPDNQRKIARILAKMSNRGIKIIVSTHSDYFIRELNNLIMLNDDFSEKNNLLKKYGYTKDMLLDSNNIGAYLFGNNTIKELNKNNEEGILVTTFDKVINNLNESSDDIYYSKIEQ